MSRQLFRPRPFGLRRFLRDASGAAMVETALIMPVLALFLLGIIEFGRLWNVRQVMTDATREGARVAVVNTRLDLNQAQLEDSVRSTIQRRLATARLDTTAARLRITADASTGIRGEAGEPAQVTIRYNYPLMFGQFLLRRDNLTLRSTYQMRNE